MVLADGPATGEIICILNEVNTMQNVQMLTALTWPVSPSRNLSLAISD